MRGIQVRYILTKEDELKVLDLALSLMERSNTLFNLQVQGWKIKDRLLGTGKTDKNDTPIFEGDILHSNYTTQTSRVCWDADEAGFYLERVSIAQYNQHIDFREEKHWWRAEVKGNIHQNPELLEVTA